jgi:hypothetical protein
MTFQERKNKKHSKNHDFQGFEWRREGLLGGTEGIRRTESVLYDSVMVYT